MTDTGNNGRSINTVPLGQSKSVKTVPLASDWSYSGKKQDVDPDRVTLLQDLIFDGRNDQYRIMAGKFIGNGGESRLYLATRLSDNALVVAKIYDKIEDNAASRRKRRKINEFLSQNSDWKNSHMMPLWDYGVIAVPSEEEEEDDYHYPIDILPYCEDGRINNASYLELKQKIIPGVLEALRRIHAENMIHRDIKPENLYYYNGVVIVGDFGTMSEANKEQNFIGTTLRRGTLGYTAPEVWQGYASIESDYYSLGCTIATLYNGGKHVYQQLIDGKDEGALNKAINDNGFPLHCPESEKDLQALVNCLAQMDEKKRIGYDGVKLWLTNPGDFEARYSKLSVRTKGEFDFNFEGVHCTTKSELIKQFVSKWNVAKDYLYRGGAHNSTLVTFFTRIDPPLAVRLGNIIEDRNTARNFDLGLAMTLHYLDNAGPLYWQGLTFHSSYEISAAIDNSAASKDCIISMLKSRYLTWKLTQQQGISTETLKSIDEVEQLSLQYDTLAYWYAKYVFASEAEPQSFYGYNTADELVSALCNQAPKIFYDDVFTVALNDEILAFLMYCGFKGLVLEFKRNLTDDRTRNMELFYRLLESVCSNKNAIRRHYIQYGPQSDLYWLSTNINIYNFNSAKAQNVKRNFVKVQLSETDSIDRLAQKFSELREYKKDLLNMFKNDALFSFFGLTPLDGANEITTSSLDGFFIMGPFGSEVPAGYVRFIGTYV